MHVVPEIGEEVIVSFENGNAEKPVSLGAVFNGKGKSGHGGAGNYMKGLQTASGSKILMNDNTGSVLLEDHGQTSMKFDGAGNSSLGTSSSQTIVVGGSGESPDGQACLKMDKDGNITLEGKTKIILKVGDSEIEITADKIKEKSTEITLDSETAAIIGSKLTEIGKEGADPGIKIDGSVTVKGGEVDIN
jgi:uncharacterized protein involved in type VI secretion and phage assembly